MPTAGGLTVIAAGLEARGVVAAAVVARRAELLAPEQSATNAVSVGREPRQYGPIWTNMDQYRYFRCGNMDGSCISANRINASGRGQVATVLMQRLLAEDGDQFEAVCDACWWKTAECSCREFCVWHFGQIFGIIIK
eukprot:SAG31_NODE_938_length_10882_cov_18.550032_10_plen_137_part_00